MDKNELERRLEAAEKQNLGLLDEIKNLKEKLAQMQDEPEIPDVPYFGDGEKYWFVYNDLSTTDANMRFCGGSIKCFNAFHSKEAAQEFANKCKLIAMMLHCKWHCDRDYVPDWNNHNEEKFHALFNHDSHKFIAYSYGSRYIDEGLVFFSTEENAQKCADWINKHWKEDGNGKTNSKAP